MEVDPPPAGRQPFGSYTIGTCVVLLFLAIAIAAYQSILHPLAPIPGPRLAAFSNIWHAYQARRGRMLELATSLHAKYGPVVRVGPNEVWFNSVDAFRVIYAANTGFEKSEFYFATLFGKSRLDVWFNVQDLDTLDLFSERNMKRYRSQRRLIGPVYQASNVRKWESAVDRVLRHAVEQLTTLQGAEVDLTEWMHIIVLECLGEVVISWSPGFLHDMTDHESGLYNYLAWRRRVVFGLFPWAEVLQSYFPFLGRLFADIWGVSYQRPQTGKTVFEGAFRQIRKGINAVLREKRSRGGKNDLLGDLINLHKNKPEFTENYLRRMAMTNFGAGHETMTATLTAALAAIAADKNVIAKARAELDVAVGGGVMDAQIPYTRACIKESQRLRPVIGMSLPRTVPAAGLRLHGHYFPPGTTVGCNPISLHRNPEICGPDPDAFIPERWLDAETAVSLERGSLVWGGGSRTCPGRHLAEMMILRIVPTLLRKFKLEVVMPAERDFRFYYLAMMTGINVRFIPRNREIAEAKSK